MSGHVCSPEVLPVREEKPMTALPACAGASLWLPCVEKCHFIARPIDISKLVETLAGILKQRQRNGHGGEMPRAFRGTDVWFRGKQRIRGGL